MQRKFRYEMVIRRNVPTDIEAHVIDHKTRKIVMQGTVKDCNAWIEETLDMLRQSAD